MWSCVTKLDFASWQFASALRCALLTLTAWWTHKELVAHALLEYVIPLAAGVALLASSWLAIRQVQRSLLRAWRGEKRQMLTRRGLVVSLSSLLFAASCFYRAIFVADEGAGLCRGVPSVFNAPASGRLVATVGEIALVVQISSYIVGTSRRLDAKHSLWSKFKRFTYLPVTIAECLSWSGVLSGVTKFFCLEYIVWMLMALTWAWDSAMLLRVSRSWRDVVGHCSLFLASIGLLFFNACIEIPHFFAADEGGDDGGLESAFACRQDVNSPIWVKRLPFFFAYFLGCSWCSVALSYSMFATYGWGKGEFSKYLCAPKNSHVQMSSSLRKFLKKGR